MNAEFIKM